MLAVLHVFAVGLEDTRVGARLRKNFAQHFQIETERGAQAKSFSQSGGVDVHHHVDERFYFCGFAGSADEPDLCGKLLEDRLGFSECFLGSAAHQIKLPFARLGNARGHARLECLRACVFCQFFDLDVNLRRDRCAIYEELAACVDQQIIARSAENRSHCVVVGDNSEDHVRSRGNFR